MQFMTVYIFRVHRRWFILFLSFTKYDFIHDTALLLRSNRVCFFSSTVFSVQSILCLIGHHITITVILNRNYGV